jgi:tight adherence protein B
MGAFVGLCLGLGLLLAYTGVSARPREADAAQRHPAVPRVRRTLDQAGLPAVPVWAFWSVVAGAGTTVGLFVLVVTASTHVALVVAAGAGYAPWALLSSRARRTRDHRGHAWADVVDDLTSAIRAGLSLPESLAQLGERGPASLRPAFARFGRDYRAGGRFHDSLDRLKGDLADPVGDRVVEALRMAREVGGHDLGTLLRTLSQFLRDDARVRGELQSRQAWTVNGARLAVAAPWFVLGLMATRPQAVAAYDTAAGAVVLVGGVLVCAVAYRLMMRIGRLPLEPRVLA